MNDVIPIQVVPGVGLCCVGCVFDVVVVPLCSCTIDDGVLLSRVWSVVV